MNLTNNWWQNIMYHFMKKYGFTVVLVSLVFGIGGAITYKEFSTPQYIATGQMSQNDNNYNIISSYNQFISTDRFKASIKSKITKPEWKSIKYSISMTNNANSPFFNVSARSSNAEFSKFLADETMKLLMSEIGSYLSGTNMSQLSKPKVVQENISTSKMMKIGMVIFFGILVLLSGLIILCTRFLGQIRNEKYLQDTLGIVDLGTLDLRRDIK